MLNPVLIFLILMCLVLIWFLLSFSYKHIGNITKKIVDNAINEMKTEENKKDIPEDIDKKFQAFHDDVERLDFLYNELINHSKEDKEESK